VPSSRSQRPPAPPSIVERQIVVREDVRGACEILGLDPLHLANEGRFLAIVPGRSRRADARSDAGQRGWRIGGDHRTGSRCGAHPVTLTTTIGTTPPRRYVQRGTVATDLLNLLSRESKAPATTGHCLVIACH
jgi:hypothetical protein